MKVTFEADSIYDLVGQLRQFISAVDGEACGDRPEGFVTGQQQWGSEWNVGDDLPCLPLDRCPNCGGPADNGHDRGMPPSPYYCTKCMAELNDCIRDGALDAGGE